MNRYSREVSFTLFILLFSTCFWNFKSSSGSKQYLPDSPLVFIVVTSFIHLWFFLLPGSVSVYVQFLLIVWDKLSLLKMLFFTFSFYKSVSIWVCVFVDVRIYVCVNSFSVFSLLYFSSPSKWTILVDMPWSSDDSLVKKRNESKFFPEKDNNSWTKQILRKKL